MAQQPRNLGQAVALPVQIAGKATPEAVGADPIDADHLAGITQHQVSRLPADVATLAIVVGRE
ncbi:MAG: hypothetical protein WBA43_19120 [Elainellaceae cyanobacterium]